MVLSILLLSPSAFGAKEKHGTEDPNYVNNRYPLQSKPYMELPVGTVKAEGWLYEQLNRIRKGMTGNLDHIYESVMGGRNGWLGGDRDLWERGPYWIDGLLPLAYILEDKELMEKVQPWIEWSLASQKPNGYFGPDKDFGYEPGLQRDNAKDWWPKMVMLKIMQQYYSATGDDRVITFLTNYFKYQLEQLPVDPLGKWTFWAQQRGGENLMVVYWLYNITGDEFLLELGDLLHQQTLDWTDLFLTGVHLYRQNSLHCVNLAHGFKEPVIYYQRNKDPKQLESVKTGMKTIRTTIGFPTGLWAGDELIRYGDPSFGSEFCTAVEMMFSLEKMLEITGDVEWADQLERIAYNALPTQATEDFSARQYYQQINQIRVTNESRCFSTPHEGTDNLFGELTGYPCCTSNMHQGWPKYTRHLWMASADYGIAALLYAPSRVSAKVGNGIGVSIREETNYPFEESVRFTFAFEDRKVKKAFFPFHLRIPGWCREAKILINGKEYPGDTPPGEMVRIAREWSQGDVLTLELPMKVDVSYWYGGSAVIERGPLVYALKMNEKWEKKMEPAGSHAYSGRFYYEVTSDSPWNYCFNWQTLRPENIADNFVAEKSDKMPLYPWSWQDAPVTLRVKANLLPSWQVFRGSVGPIPYYMQNYEPIGEENIIELIPYGCTTLRITEFPVRHF